MKKITPFLFLVLLFGSCTLTSTQSVDLNPSGKEILSKIKSSYQFEEVNALSTFQSGSEKKDFITLQLVNGQNLPASEQLPTLGGNFANALVQVLNTPHQYKSITVVFMTKKESGLTTTTSSTSYDYTIR